MMAGAASRPVDVATWKRFGWGLAAPDDDVLAELLPDVPRREDRRRSHSTTSPRRSIERGNFTPRSICPEASAWDDPASFLGRCRTQRPRFARADESGELTVIERHPGDARVLRSSALMDSGSVRRSGPRASSPRSTGPDVTFVFSDTSRDDARSVLHDNILWRLLDAPR
jgi:hypothetical protein